MNRLFGALIRDIYQPLRNVVRHGASLRQTGFVEAIDVPIEIVGVDEGNDFPYEGASDTGLDAEEFGADFRRFFELIQMAENR